MPKGRMGVRIYMPQFATVRWRASSLKFWAYRNFPLPLFVDSFGVLLPYMSSVFQRLLKHLVPKVCHVHEALQL